MKVVNKLGGYKDPDVTTLARDLQKGFDAVPDQRICYATVVWKEPWVLTVPPTVAAEPVRRNPPAALRCDRAVNLSDRSVLVTPGGVSWTWLGNGQVQIDAVSGLVPGVQYDLVFTAVG